MTTEATMINLIIWALAIWIAFLIYLTLTDQRVEHHDRNLTDGKGPKWRHGRAWWYITPRDENNWRHGPGVRLEWSIASSFNNFDIDLTVLGDEGEDIQIHLAVPWLFGVWLTIERLPILDRLPYRWRRTYGYQTSLAIHNGSIWIYILHTDMWGSRPVWRWLPRWISVWASDGYKDEWRGVGFYICLDFDRLIFGSYERTEETIGQPVIREIPIEPDNRLGLYYFATFKRMRETRWRGHFPWRRRQMVYWEIQVDDPPLHAGKGESSHDQDDDGIINTSAFVETIEAAIADYQERVQRDRKKYGLPGVIYERQREVRK